MRVGFVGLGAMGRAMASVLLRAENEVVAWNRTRDRADALTQEGATVANTPAEAASAGVVISMVADDAALEAVTTGAQGILAGLPPDGVHLSMSTVAPDTIERLARRHADAGHVLVSAPVFGRPEAAAAGGLYVVAAGSSAAIEKARPLLETLGKRVFIVGDEPSQANVVKLAGNFMISAMIETLAEALALMGKAGISREKFVEVVTQSLFSAPVYQTYGRILLEGRFSPPGFLLPLGAKDNRLFLQTGERHQVPLPIASLVRDRMLAALARGYGDQDWSAFSRIAVEDAGAH